MTSAEPAPLGTAATRRDIEHAVWRILASADTVAEAMQRTLQAVCRLGAWRLGEAWWVDPREQVLRLVDQWHAESLSVKDFVAASDSIAFRAGIGLPGRVWANRNPAWLMDVLHDDNFPRAALAARAGLSAAFAFPVSVVDDVLGVLCFLDHQPRPPDDDLLQSMDIIGSQLGTMVHREQQRNALRASEARYRALFEQLEQAVILMQGGVAVDCNPATLRLFGLASRLELLGRSPADFSPPTQPDGQRSEVAAGHLLGRTLAGEALVFEWRFRRLDGTTLDAEVRMHSIRLGAEPLVQCIITDISLRKSFERQLVATLKEVRAVSLRDPLTGAYNRRHFDEALVIEVAGACRHGVPLAAVMIDLDHFKNVNDDYGHSAGDFVLQAVVRTLVCEIRTEDILARYGGEEFVVLLRSTSTDEAVTLAERLRRTVADLRVTVANETLQVTLSIGVASLDECSERTGEQLLRLADERLYAAKAGGRNQVMGPSGARERPLDRPRIGAGRRRADAGGGT